MERICHQTKEATMRANPNHATMFFIVPPNPSRQDIVTFEDSTAALRREEFDNESRFSRRARAQRLQSSHS